jgi:hypothetical protein
LTQTPSADIVPEMYNSTNRVNGSVPDGIVGSATLGHATARGFIARSAAEIEETLGRAGFTAVLTTESRDSANRRFFSTVGTDPGHPLS